MAQFYAFKHQPLNSYQIYLTSDNYHQQIITRSQIVLRNLIIFLFLLSVVTLRGQGLTKTFKVSDRIFDVPESWKSESPSSKMRNAQYRNGKSEIVVFYFGKGSD